MDKEELIVEMIKSNHSSVTRQIGSLGAKFNKHRAETEKKFESLHKWRWRIEGSLFLACGIMSAIMTAVVTCVVEGWFHK